MVAGQVQDRTTSAAATARPPRAAGPPPDSTPTAMISRSPSASSAAGSTLYCCTTACCASAGCRGCRRPRSTARTVPVGAAVQVVRGSSPCSYERDELGHAGPPPDVRRSLSCRGSLPLTCLRPQPDEGRRFVRDRGVDVLRCAVASASKLPHPRSCRSSRRPRRRAPRSLGAGPRMLLGVTSVVPVGCARCSVS